MARLCPACAAQIESDSARFCGTCGGRLDAVSAAEVATVVERVRAPEQPTPASAAAPVTEAVEFTAVCPSCGAANPADTEICQFCGEEIPVDERRRRTGAVFGALGAGGAGLAGGLMAGREAGEAMRGMGEAAGQGMQGLGQVGPGMQGLGQAGPAIQGLGGAAPQEAVSGMGAAQAGSAGTPGIAGPQGASGLGAGSGPPGASPASMGASGAPPTAPAPPASPGGGPLPGDASAVAPPVSPSSPGYVPAAPVAEGGKSIGGIIGKTVLGGIGVIGGAALGAVVLGGILVFTGDPSACVERSSVASDEAVTSLFAKWEEFKVAAAAGPATVTFTEPEVTSRAVQYVNEKDIPLEDLQVYFCPDGKGQVKGKVRALGRDINVLLEGTVDTSVQPPVIVVEEIKAGNLPSAVAEQIVGDRLDKNDVKTLNFGIPISAVIISDGQVTLESPGP